MDEPIGKDEPEGGCTNHERAHGRNRGRKEHRRAVRAGIDCDIGRTLNRRRLPVRLDGHVKRATGFQSATVFSRAGHRGRAARKHASRGGHTGDSDAPTVVRCGRRRIPNRRRASGPRTSADDDVARAIDDRRYRVANDNNREITSRNKLPIGRADHTMNGVYAQAQRRARWRIAVHLHLHVRTLVGNDDGIGLRDVKVFARVVGDERRRANDRDTIRNGLRRRVAGGPQEEQKQSCGHEPCFVSKTTEPR